MKYWTLLDDVLMDYVFEPLAYVFHLVTGKSNFLLAKILFIFAAAITIAQSALRKEGPGGSLFVILATTLLVCGFIPFVEKNTVYETQIGFPPLVRYHWVMIIMRYAMLASVFTLITGWMGGVGAWHTEKFAYDHEMSMIFIATFFPPFFFIACQPRPPGPNMFERLMEHFNASQPT
jgi:hypothetical protein